MNAQTAAKHAPTPQTTPLPDAKPESLAGMILEADVRKVNVGQPIRGVKADDE